MTQNLPRLPYRMQKLPRDHRGFPIPWFVATVPSTGERDFRVADTEKMYRAIRNRLCWVCGEKLGRNLAFVIGPMCVVNRTTSEPPCHLDCAIFSATACPFLTRPRMRRNEKDIPTEARDPAGEFLTRNPGATCIYVCDSYNQFKANGGDLIRLGEPHSVHWYVEGKVATRQQIVDAMAAGFPTLEEMAKEEGPVAVSQLQRQLCAAQKLLPAGQPVAAEDPIFGPL